MIVPPDYPVKPPEMHFVGMVPYHYNIDSTGKICSDSIKKWNSKSNMIDLILNINNLLYHPNNDHGLRKECKFFDNYNRENECK